MFPLVTGLCLSLVFPQPSFAATPCTRAQLKALVDSYVAVQTAGSPTTFNVSDAVSYQENDKNADFKTGILSTPLKIDSSRYLLDTVQCATFSELIVTDQKHPYVIGTQIRLADGVITSIESRVTDGDDWLFNATGTLHYASLEDWSEIPEEKRDTREVLKAGADAYCNIFKDKNTVVPWGIPCNRLEGGTYIGTGSPDDSCNVGVPSGIDLANRRYVIDEVYGSVDVFLNFGGPEGAPDSHQFRFLGGKLRYVHTMTITDGVPLPPPDRRQAKEKRDF